MIQVFLRSTAWAVMVLSLAACGGGGGSSSGGGGGIILPPGAGVADEVVDVDAELSNRASSTDSASMGYVLRTGGTTGDRDAVTITYDTGAVAGGLLDGTDIDDSIYENPANGEFSRIVRQNTPNLLGVVGLDVPMGSLPDTGQTNYNEGWVGMNVNTEEEALVLEGDAVFAAAWGSGNVAGEFSNLSEVVGGASVDGTITLTDARISGDTFAGGQVSGTGIFDDLGASSSTTGTAGRFFGPEADELGGVLVIDDPDADIAVFGAFQAD